MVLADFGRKGLCTRAAHRDTDWISPGSLKKILEDVRSHHTGIAPGLTFGVVATGSGFVPEFRQAGLRTGRFIPDCNLFDVADGFEHSGRRASCAAGLSERGARPE